MQTFELFIDGFSKQILGEFRKNENLAKAAEVFQKLGYVLFGAVLVVVVPHLAEGTVEAVWSRPLPAALSITKIFSRKVYALSPLAKNFMRDEYRIDTFGQIHTQLISKDMVPIFHWFKVQARKGFIGLSL